MAYRAAVHTGRPLFFRVSLRCGPVIAYDKESALTNDTTAAPTADDLPTHWSDAARDSVGEVLEVRPDLSGADLAALREVGELLTDADALAAVARAAGYIATGSTGQTVVHPATTAALHHRDAASRILARLVAPTSGAETASQRGRRAARARWSR